MFVTKLLEFRTHIKSQLSLRHGSKAVYFLKLRFVFVRLESGQVGEERVANANCFAFVAPHGEAYMHAVHSLRLVTD